MNNNLRLTHPKLYACLHHSKDIIIGATINVIIGGALGGAYGYLFKTEPILTAKLAAIHFVAGYIFEEVNKVVTGDPKKEAKKFYLVQLVGEAVIQVIALLAYRHFNIIGNLGTGMMVLYILAAVGRNLEPIKPKSNVDEEFEKALKICQEHTAKIFKKVGEPDQIEEIQKKDEPEQQDPPKVVQPIENEQPEEPLPIQN